MATTLEKASAVAMIKFAYFTANFPMGFINKVWADSPSMANHLNEKLTYYMRIREATYVSYEVFMTWFVNLDGGNQFKLCLWIEENFSPTRDMVEP